jgi:hypothetical protein
MNKEVNTRLVEDLPGNALLDVEGRKGGGPWELIRSSLQKAALDGERTIVLPRTGYDEYRAVAEASIRCVVVDCMRGARRTAPVGGYDPGLCLLHNARWEGRNPSLLRGPSELPAQFGFWLGEQGPVDDDV